MNSQPIHSVGQRLRDHHGAIWIVESVVKGRTGYQLHVRCAMPGREMKGQAIGLLTTLPDEHSQLEVIG